MAIFPSRDFSCFAIVVYHEHLYLRNDLDEDLDYIPFGLCPVLATMVVVDSEGNVRSAVSDLMYVSC